MDSAAIRGLYGLFSDKIKKDFKAKKLEEYGQIFFNVHGADSLAFVELLEDVYKRQVMPSFIFSDYGDFLRSGANTGLEDDKNPDNVNFNKMCIRDRGRGTFVESALTHTGHAQ